MWPRGDKLSLALEHASGASPTSRCFTSSVRRRRPCFFCIVSSTFVALCPAATIAGHLGQGPEMSDRIR